MIKKACCVFVLTASAAFAQERIPAPADQVVRLEIEKQAASKLRGIVEMRTTKGAPFSGEAITEFVQTLADGNRIARRTMTRIYRDSEGRVRREHLAADGSTVESVTIADPLAGTSIVLDPNARTAYRAGRTRGEIAPARESQSKRVLELQAKVRTGQPPPPPAAPPAVDPTIVPPVPPPAPPPGARGSLHVSRGTREDLGQRSVEGVAAQGTRTTTVIPAGAIGNDQPIRIVSEEWFSTDLQVLVQTRHSDPRSGETTYTLTNIVRAEPDRSLFEVPADYSFNMPTKLELRSRD